MIQKLEEWQIERKKVISEKETSSQHLREFNGEVENMTQFNSLFKIFVDSATIDRTASILQSDLTFLEISNSVLKATVIGSKQDPYIIEINSPKRILKHDCHDFITRKSKEKKFCKHIAKMFLLLKDNNERIAKKILNEIAMHVNDWDFSS